MTHEARAAAAASCSAAAIAGALVGHDARPGHLEARLAQEAAGLGAGEVLALARARRSR